MHMVIRTIVYAEDEEEALTHAKEVFDGLAGEGKPFDYYTTFDEESSVSGKSRWGQLPVVASADSLEGRQLIEEGMKATEDEFKETIAKVRKLLETFTDEEIFEGRPLRVETQVAIKLKGDDTALILSGVDYYFHKLARYEGTNVWLYDNDGSPIKDRSVLKTVMSKWDDEKLKDLKVFVVPADVHS